MLRLGIACVYVMYSVTANSRHSNMGEAGFVYRDVQRFDGLGRCGGLSRLGPRMRDFEQPPGSVAGRLIPP